MKTAIVLGATGLVGSNLVELLEKDDRFDKIKIFTRRKTSFKSSKTEELLINFDQPQDWGSLIKGDVLFSTLGTTLKQAGSKEAQFQVDYTYQYWFASFAAENDVPVYVLVSSAGASLNSMFFYSQMKARLEKDIAELPFKQSVIIRPSGLEGSRQKERPAEKIGIKFLKAVTQFGIVRKYRPIEGAIVAQAMINATFLNLPKTSIFELDKIFELAKKA